MSDEMEEIIVEFITEAEESLDKIEPLFVELEKKGQDKDLLNEIFRSMHTIKGAAGFLGFQSIVDVSHTSENIMKKLRDGEIVLSRELMDVILAAIDMLRVLLTHLKEKDGVEENVAPLVANLEQALKGAMASDGGQDTSPGDAVTPDATGEAIAKEPFGEPEPVPESLPRGSEKNCSTLSKNEVSDLSEEVHQSESARTAREAQPKPESHPPKEASQKSKDGAQNLRVDISRIDKVMDLAGEVVLVRNRLLNISNHFEDNYETDPRTDTLMETVTFLDRVTSELQLAVMKIRMQPIKKVFSKFPRLVRDISASLNKEVDLEIYGEGTEVDKSVIEHIGDPMTHILRNSIDHGLETREERLAKGKPEKGKVVITTAQKGNHIVIEITDDGKGMDLSKLKKKAVERGLMSNEDAEKLSDDAATDIIFMPGFSTKDVATEMSGRGVGMDVVRTNISLLNGYVEVSTKQDAGTTFRISIPLTLAIIQALMVEVSGVKYAIPLSPIEETLKVATDEIDNVTGQRVIVIRDKVCPLFELSDILDSDSNGGHDGRYKYLLVISLGDKKFCLAVDRLLGQEEVVIKTLKGVDTSSSNILGATITGDGNVVFILDVTSMSRSLLEMAKT